MPEPSEQFDRRQFLTGSGLALAATGAALVGGPSAPASGQEKARTEKYDWDSVRALFDLSGDVIHMSALLIASHPAPVRKAIEKHRRGLDANPVTYLQTNNSRLDRAARDAAGRYLGIAGSNIALTDSTTMGLGLVYNGLRLNPDQEILSSGEDYYATDESLRLAARRSGATIRQIRLFKEARSASADEIVGRIRDEIRPATRVLALTWVHSSTGLKLPLAEIGKVVAEANSGRDEGDRVLLCVDAVHAFGTENASFEALGCDFLIAGCHKWLFGPRGTGIVAATPRAWRAALPIIPSFIDDAAWAAWLRDSDSETTTTTARSMTPGGFKPFEHRWAMTAAFELHQQIGKSRVTARTHELASRLKEGLSDIKAVTLRTPSSPELSSGIVAFDVSGIGPDASVDALRGEGVIASVAPYSSRHVRLTPSIRNTPEEIDKAIAAVRAIAS